MFNPEGMPPLPPKEEETEKAKKAILPEQNQSGEQFADQWGKMRTKEVPHEDRETEHTLSRDMSQDEINALAGKLVAERSGQTAQTEETLLNESYQKEALQDDSLREAVIAETKKIEEQPAVSSAEKQEKSFDLNSVLAPAFRFAKETFGVDPSTWTPQQRKAVMAAFFSGLAAASPMKAEAKSNFWDNLTKTVVSQTVQDYRQNARQQQQRQYQQQQRAERAAEQDDRQRERTKEQYAQESQRVVDQYDRGNEQVEKNYANQEQRRLSNTNTRNQDAGVNQKIAERVEISYHREKLNAAGKAWGAMERVKEKYVQIGSLGVPYQSQVNEQFLLHLQKVAAQETKDLQKFGVEVVTIIPLFETSTGHDHAPQSQGFRPPMDQQNQ